MARPSSSTGALHLGFTSVSRERYAFTRQPPRTRTMQRRGAADHPKDHLTIATGHRLTAGIRPTVRPYMALIRLGAGRRGYACRRHELPLHVQVPLPTAEISAIVPCLA
jgi:hypothetical protein